MSSSSPMQRAIEALLEVLQDQLPAAPPAPLPAHSVSIVSVTERAVGIGDRRGTEVRAAFPLLALKGIRLDTVARFQLWAAEPANLDSMIDALHASLGGSSTELRTRGFLQLAAVTTSLAENIQLLNAWRKTADYRILFEFNYEEVDGAESLIARIPVSINDVFGESMLITDEMVRWDDVEAASLEVRGGARRPFEVKSVSILAFLPDGWDGDGVTISTQVGGVVRDLSFPSVRAFRDSFDLEPETESVTLGENLYRAGHLDFPNPDFPDPVILSRGGDLFRISYSAPSFDSEAVVYLRVLR